MQAEAAAVAKALPYKFKKNISEKLLNTGAFLLISSDQIFKKNQI